MIAFVSVTVDYDSAHSAPMCNSARLLNPELSRAGGSGERVSCSKTCGTDVCGCPDRALTHVKVHGGAVFKSLSCFIVAAPRCQQLVASCGILMSMCVCRCACVWFLIVYTMCAF